jgi:predicted RNase H-like HicB family nuclease
MADLPHYHINLFFSDEDGAWIAAVPDLQNANAHGETPEEALREIAVVMEMWLDSWMDNHDAPPPARYRPAPLSQAG